MTTIRNTVKFRDVIAEFNQIKTSKLSGNLAIEVLGAPSWLLCFSAGKLAGISGGIDAIDRWQRNLALASLNMPLDRLVKSNDRQEVFLNSNKIAQELAAKEVIFDIIQFSQNNGDRLSIRFIPVCEKNTRLKSVLPLLDIQPIITLAIQAWQEWARKGLAFYQPSFFPCIQNREKIPKSIDKNLLLLIDSIDGNRSLRTLAIYHQKHLIDIGISLQPLLESQAIIIHSKPLGVRSEASEEMSLNETDDRVEISSPFGVEADISNSDDLNAKPIPLIACIDDSISVYKSLEQIITGHGYRSYGVQDALKIIPTLLRNKPDLIFLDLVMPVTNGYEVCEQIRKTPSLSKIPIIILTGSDGLIDRMRTKFVGANGFLGKPIEASTVIKMMDKYLDRSSKPLKLVPKSDADTANSAIKSKLILVVDDDRNIREVVSMCLHKLKKWEVVTAASAREGLNSIKSKHPDAIVLDVMMPEMDGLAFLRHLRADRATKFIPVVLLTANRYLPDKELLDELGVVEIVSKPFLPIDIVRQIDRALDGNTCLVRSIVDR